jgi:hypothetical protein
MRNITNILIALVLSHASVLAADPTAAPSYEHPVIDGHGGTVVLMEAEHQPKPNAKVVLDITSDEKLGSVLKGFDRAALILNQYTQAGAGEVLSIVVFLSE